MKRLSVVILILCASVGWAQTTYQRGVSSADFQNVAKDTLGWFNVKAYGAVGNGTTDDLLAIQAALDACTASGGGTVFLPMGVFYTTNTLIIGSNTVVLGSGMGNTTLRVKSGSLAGKTVSGTTVYAGLGTVGTSNVRIEGLTVDLATNSTQANGITCMATGGLDSVGTSPTNYIVAYCSILKKHPEQYAIWTVKANNAKFLYNIVDGGRTTDSACSQEGIEIIGGKDILFEGNTVTNIGNYGIYVQSGVSFVGADVNNVRVVNNYISVAQAGVAITATLGAASAKANISNVFVSGNTILKTWDQAILATTATGDTLRNIDISNNTVDSSYSAVWISCENGVGRGIKVSSNQFRNTSAAGNDVGTIRISYTNDVFIGGNSIWNSAGSGVTFILSKRFMVENNFFGRLQKSGMLIQYCNEGKITGNTFSDWNLGNAGANIGVFCNPQDTNIVISGNMFWTSHSLSAVWADNTSSNISIGPNQIYYTIADPYDNTSVATTEIYNSPGVFLINAGGFGITTLDSATVAGAAYPTGTIYKGAAGYLKAK